MKLLPMKGSSLRNYFTSVPTFKLTCTDFGNLNAGDAHRKLCAHS